MPHFKSDPRYSILALLGLGIVASFQAPVSAQDDGGFRSNRNPGNRNNGNNGNNNNGNNGDYGNAGANPGFNGRNRGQGTNSGNGIHLTSGHTPSLSECTANLEAAVKSLYKNIEPGDDPSPNELVTYADLRALRLYTGALEVAGWDLEQAAATVSTGGVPPSNRGRPSIPSDVQSTANHDKYLAFREAVRTLLFRVRSTAVAVEHQVSFCDPQVAQVWQSEVVPALQDTIAATNPLFIEQTTYQGYRVPGQAITNAVPVNTSGIPDDAVEVGKTPVYQPYEGRGRGQGRFFEVRAFGGPVKVKTIRYRSHENSFGVIGTSVLRELTVDQVASPNDPIFVPCNRERYVDLSDLEVEWESVDNRRKSFASIEVIGDRPTAQRQATNREE